MAHWLRRLLGRGEPQHPVGLLDLLRVVATGDDEREVERVAREWAMRQREESERAEERAAYEQAARDLEEKVRRGPGWFPSDP